MDSVWKRNDMCHSKRNSIWGNKKRGKYSTVNRRLCDYIFSIHALQRSYERKINNGFMRRCLIKGLWTHRYDDLYSVEYYDRIMIVNVVNKHIVTVCRRIHDYKRITRNHKKIDYKLLNNVGN